MFADLYKEYLNLEYRIIKYTKQVSLISQSNEQSKRLITIPGIGEMTATAMLSSISDFKGFRNGRDLSAWIGLVPRQRSSGNKSVLLGISKRGDKYLRTLLIHGARSVVNKIKDKVDRNSLWIKRLLERNGFNKTIVAVANKNVRIAWSVITKDSSYDAAYMH